MNTSFVCPYCFERHKIEEVQFRCMNRRCKDVPDMEITRYYCGSTSAPRMGKTTFPAIRTGRGIADKAACPVCQSESHMTVCPSCHNKLPEATLSGEDLIIAIVGARDTGKTHYMTVIINELLERVAPDLGGAMEGFDDSFRRYRNDSYRTLYEDQKTLPLTESFMANPEKGKPLIFTLKMPKKGLFGKDNRSLTMVFFDTAGEDLNEEETMSTVNKYIYRADGIIFLLDPLQMGEVRKQVDPRVVAGSATVDPSKAGSSDDIMTRVSKLIRKGKGLREDKAIDIPVAAVFSKLDAVAELIPAGSRVLENSPHCSRGGFDEVDSQNVDMEIQSMLRTWGARSFMSQASTNYSNLRYFAVSSLGLCNNPEIGGNIKKPRPHRIEDALLWVLKENGFIKAVK